MSHEEEYKKREGEVMEQNKQILKEKIELENSLRKTFVFGFGLIV